MLRRSLLLSLLLFAPGCGNGGDGGLSSECGNGVIEDGETCDEGDLLPCDGCSPTCQDEVGFVCGDAELNVGCGEACDDGNTRPGDGCDENCQVEDGGPLDLDGFYDVSISTTSDGCGFGLGSASTPIAVEELTPTTARVDVPLGGAGGSCNAKVYTRRGDTLERTETSIQTLGDCVVEVHVTTTLAFAAGLSVTGTEIDALSEVGGDCSALPLPCSVELAIEGASCPSCFSCVPPLGAPEPRLLGSFGSAVRRARR